uniref:WIF domain-containing protein n=1 Tax=Anopheles dirus TaxID=7168 RepID=A0A182NIE0_9DIPT
MFCARCHILVRVSFVTLLYGEPHQKLHAPATGIEADLFYVRDGAVNDYAMSFVVPMKPGIDFLRFSWQSRTAYPRGLHVPSFTAKAAAAAVVEAIAKRK